MKGLLIYIGGFCTTTKGGQIDSWVTMDSAVKWRIVCMKQT